MSIAAKLIDSYNNKLMADGNVRNLARAVTQDPQNETVDMIKSAETVRRAVVDDGGVARRKIIAWLNSVFFSLEMLPIEWWFEMSTRIQKLLIVSMILEGDNLRSFGAIPQTSDIPQCLTVIWIDLDQVRSRLSALRNEYAKRIKHVCTTEEGKNYVNLYVAAKEK